MFQSSDNSLQLEPYKTEMQLVLLAKGEQNFKKSPQGKMFKICCSVKKSTQLKYNYNKTTNITRTLECQINIPPAC